MAVPFLTTLAVAVGLFLDASFPDIPGHVAANLFVALCFAMVFRAATAHERRSLLLCVAVATLGELFLCFGWGLYEYRHGNLPPFVPLGHSMIFLTGCRLAPAFRPWIWRAVAAGSAVGVAALAVTGVDTAGLLWYPLFALCLVLSPARPLYGVMFLLALAVEVAGTRAGSWVWFDTVPWFGLRSTNPPLCAGTFYCVLDLLVLTAERAFDGARGRAAAADVAAEPDA